MLTSGCIRFLRIFKSSFISLCPLGLARGRRQKSDEGKPTRHRGASVRFLFGTTPWVIFVPYGMSRLSFNVPSRRYKPAGKFVILQQSSLQQLRFKFMTGCQWNFAMTIPGGTESSYRLCSYYSMDMGSPLAPMTLMPLVTMRVPLRCQRSLSEGSAASILQ